MLSTNSIIFWALLLLVKANLIEMKSSNFIAYSHIVGGNVAVRGDFPYQGFLQRDDNSTCGCSLLNSKWAITAAHCTFNTTAAEFKVFFGEVDKRKFINNSYALHKIHQHSAYDDSDITFQNDISLLEFDGEVIMSEYVAPIALPNSGETAQPGGICNISGWGSLSEGFLTSDVLQKAQVPVLNNTYCNELYNSTNFEIFSGQLCAGFAQGGIDSCNGDSGGPLACRSSSGIPVLQGVVSFGDGCARVNKPGVYTRITFYLDWIEKRMKNNATTATVTKFYVGLFSFNAVAFIIYIWQ